MNNKKAFSFVEIIITISIIALLAVIGISSQNSYENKMLNSKVISNLETLNNALEQYSQENSQLPMPGGNNNFFKIDTSYAHNYEDIETFGVHGFITESTFPKKYIDVLPKDPRVGAYYAYGKTKNTNEYEIASVQIVDSVPTSYVIGSYTAEVGPYNLIREYNGANFVNNKSTSSLAYNPDELILTAKIFSYSGTVSVNGTSLSTSPNIGERLVSGDKIIVNKSGSAEIHFSDGSVSILGDDNRSSELILSNLDLNGEDNLNTIVKLALGAGSIWNKATSLNDNSTFEIYTTDSTAAVRGTIFGVTKKNNNTEVIVVEGKVKVLKINSPTTNLADLNNTIINNNITTNPIDLFSDLIQDNIIKVEKGSKIIRLKQTTTNSDIKEFDENNGDSTEIEKVRLKIKKFKKGKTKRDKESESRVIDNNCRTFKIYGKCIEADSYLSNNEYKLIAYAPYDIAGDLNLYNKDGDTYEIKTNNISTGYDDSIKNITDLSAYSGSVIDKDSSLVSHLSHTGIIIEESGLDYLKYSDLDLEGDFAIEMSVLGLNRSGGEYTLFKLGNNKLYIYDGKLKIKNTDLDSLDKPISLNSGFYKIILEKKEDKVIIKINGEIIIDAEFEILDPDYIYIGNNKALILYNQYWDNIIDYVKIYEKE